MITIYACTSFGGSNYHDYLINKDHILWCDPTTYKVVMLDKDVFYILGKDWNNFVANLRGTK